MDVADEFRRETSLVRTLVGIADTLVTGFDVADVFDRLTTACVELLGAASAGLMLADRGGTLQLMSSSSVGMRDLEEFELAHRQGPCLDCFATHRAVAIDLISDDAAARWPSFTAEARRRGITGVQALPMRLRTETIGALNLFHTTTERFDEHSTGLAQALADIATVAILQRRALASSELLAEQLQAALNDRIVIEQAKGLLAERGRLPVDEAFRALRDYCRAARLPLTETARSLIAGKHDPDEVLAHRWPDRPRP
jgi:GAF domain-containing protein